MSKATYSPDCAYLTSANLIHPESERGADGEPRVTAAESRARTEIGERLGGVTVTGGAIKRGK